MSTANTKRACDACHRRKVRCNGSNPCHNCTQASLVCTFNKPPQKKGPKGSRAKVISELRKTQEHEMAQPSSSAGKDGLAYGELGSHVLLRTPRLLTNDLIDICVSYFFKEFYTTMPILQSSRVQQTVMDMHSSTESYCLVSSLCAFVVIQPGLQVQMQRAGDNYPASPMQQVQARCLLLVEETVRVWNSYDHKDNPTLSDVLIAFFLSAAYFGLEKANAAWIHLREAITLAQLLGMHDEATYMPGDIDGTSRRRLFWLLFVSERGFALHKHRPLTLHATIELPPIGEDEGEAIAMRGLICLINLFRTIDDNFSRAWNTARSECSPKYLASLQGQLTDALPSELNLQEAQEADIRLTQQWLRIVVWQMSTASGCLSSTSPDAFMSFTYPIDISKEVVDITHRLSQQSLEVHGIGLIEKLFDIACTLTDVMSCVPIETATFEVGPRDYLSHLLSLISTLRRGESRYVTLLQDKIRETLPTVATSFALPIPAASLERLKSNDESSVSTNSSPYSTPTLLVATPRYPTLQANVPPPSITSVPTSMGVSSGPPAALNPNPSFRMQFGDTYHV